MRYRPIGKSMLLAKAALRLASDPTLMASVLSKYSGGQLDLSELANTLGTDEPTIVRLALCKRPRPRSDLFVSDITKISVFSGIAVERLAAVVRHADALDAFRSNASTPLMAAARDKIDPVDPDADKT